MQLRLAQFESQKEDLKAQLVEATRQSRTLAEKKKQVLKKQDELGVSNESFTEIIKSLQSQRVELLIELAGIEARRDQLTELHKQSRQDAGSGALIGQLEKLVQLQKQNVEEQKTRRKTGQVTSADVRDAEIKLLEFEIRWIQERNKSRQVTENQPQLIELSLDRAEKKAKLETTESLLAKFTDSRDTLAESDKISRSIRSSNSHIAVLKSSIDQVDKSIEQLSAELKKIENDE